MSSPDEQSLGAGLERSSAGSTARSAPLRIEWPDFLRGWSALAVVLFHVRVTLWVGLRALAADGSYSAIDRAAAWVTVPFPFFGTAVMLFFVVSGFAIHYPYARAGVSLDPRSYAVRRIFRIYPPYVVAVLVTIAAEQVALGLAQVPPSSWSKVSASMAMVQNYLPPAGQMAANPSLWSLPVEMELYAVYPLLLWFWRRAGTSWMLAIVTLVSAGGAAALWAGHAWPMGNFAKYWIIWTSGAVLAERVRTGTLPRWRTWWWGLVGGGLVLAVAARAAGLPFGFEHFLWGAIYVLIVLWGLGQAEPLRHVPRWIARAGLFLGEISYSLYLVHFPVFVALGAGWLAVFGHKPVSVLVPLAASLVPIPLAYVMWRFVERPSQAWGRAMSYPPAKAATPRGATGSLAS